MNCAAAWMPASTRTASLLAARQAAARTRQSAASDVRRGFGGSSIGRGGPRGATSNRNVVVRGLERFELVVALCRSACRSTAFRRHENRAVIWIGNRRDCGPLPHFVRSGLLDHWGGATSSPFARAEGRCRRLTTSIDVFSDRPSCLHLARLHQSAYGATLPHRLWQLRLGQCDPIDEASAQLRTPRPLSATSTRRRLRRSLSEGQS